MALKILIAEYLGTSVGDEVRMLRQVVVVIGNFIRLILSDRS